MYIYYVRSNAAHTQKLYLCFTNSGKRLFCLSFASPWFWEYVCPRFVFRFGSFLFLCGVDRAWPTFFWKGLQCIATFGLGWKGVIAPIKSRTHQNMNFCAASAPEKKTHKTLPVKGAWHLAERLSNFLKVPEITWYSMGQNLTHGDYVFWPCLKIKNPCPVASVFTQTVVVCRSPAKFCLEFMV